MSIYTRNGDSGETFLIGNIKKQKSDEVFEVLGTLDEFNAYIGIILSELPFSKEASDFLVDIQKDLLKIGSLVADAKSTDLQFAWLKGRTVEIEGYIDEIDGNLPELENFILPGGTSYAAKLHFSRTICRRLERGFVKFYFKGEFAGREYVLSFLNRLSDLLFVLARFLNFSNDVSEVVWEGKE